MANISHCNTYFLHPVSSVADLLDELLESGSGGNLDQKICNKKFNFKILRIYLEDILNCKIVEVYEKIQFFPFCKFLVMSREF